MSLSDFLAVAAVVGVVLTLLLAGVAAVLAARLRADIRASAGRDGAEVPEPKHPARN